MVGRDPSFELTKIQQHLASPDKQIVLLFGAGTSAAVTGTDGDVLIPAVARLTEFCEKAVRSLGKEFGEAWDLIVAGLPANARSIEDVLSTVRTKLQAMGPKDSLAGVGRVDMGRIESTIRQTIAQAVMPAESRVPTSIPHDELARWMHRIDRLHPVELFTTNYDTLFERSLEKARVPFFDGFVGSREPFFLSSTLRYSDAGPGPSWARLWKIHGSVNWHLTESGVTRGPESADGEMILPSLLKYEESRKQPYLAMLDRLRDVLARREDGVLITAGYSFSDQHINSTIFEALGQNPRLHAFALCFEDPTDLSEVAKASSVFSNLVVLAPTHSVVGGAKSSWSVDSVESARKLQPFVDWPADFETNFKPSSGALKIGDFNRFCKLLALVTGVA